MLKITDKFTTWTTTHFNLYFLDAVIVWNLNTSIFLSGRYVELFFLEFDACQSRRRKNQWSHCRVMSPCQL
jgi:hypothetical protein